MGQCGPHAARNRADRLGPESSGLELERQGRNSGESPADSHRAVRVLPAPDLFRRVDGDRRNSDGDGQMAVFDRVLAATYVVCPQGEEGRTRVGISVWRCIQTI